MVLDKINKPNDIKKISPREYKQLASEIRKFLIEKISKTGGHLASNLGVVELTMAMQIVYNLPKDKIIWDVGHQSYAHKILTGRKRNLIILENSVVSVDFLREMKVIMTHLIQVTVQHLFQQVLV